MSASSEFDLPLKPWERLVTGMDVGSPDGDACLYAVYDALTGQLRIVDFDWSASQL